MAIHPLAADTIAAIATPPGEGAIGIIRISGPEALDCARRLFRSSGGRSLDTLRPRYVYYGHVVEPGSRRPLDETLLVYFRAPRTYTGEDLVELSCHGGRLAVQAVYRAALATGARPARPGELTLRAFLNGRIDLAQAEAVADVIRARSDRALRLAVEGLNGNLSERVSELRRTLLGALAQVTARIDFPEDDVPDLPVAPVIEPALAGLDELVQTARAGRIYREGVRLAIVGSPNVGKSSLLNRLLGANRAIVTEVPGTTRDTLEESLEIDGLLFVLTDTAGIRPTEDLVERIGIERSEAAIAGADMVIQVVDQSRALAAEDSRIAEQIAGRPGLLVANKTDLAPVADLTRLTKRARPIIQVSALTGAGIRDLERCLVELATEGAHAADHSLLVANPRHADALKRAREHVRAALQTERSGLPADFVSIDLRFGLDALGEITGESVGEDLLDAIFSQFCIGK